MSTLKPNTILKRQAGIEIQLGSAFDVRVGVNGNRALYLEHSLAILDVFAHPTSMRQAVSRLRAHGIQDWIDLTGTINKLYNAGLLIESGKEFTPDANDKGFGAPAVHISMLNDRDRTETFLRAIAEVVKPGDVVVDIGTGTGIFAVAAAHAGATRVYAIEAGTMADAAQAVFDASDVSDRLSLIRGWSTQIELPEQADVLVSEIIGRDPFEERVLQITADARWRLLKPDARLIPATIRAYCLAVTVPSNKVSDVCFTVEMIENWRDWYGVDFTPLTSIIQDSASPSLRVVSRQAAAWHIISKPLLVAEVDLNTFQETAIERVVNGEISEAGVLNGLLMFFELEVGSGTITTHPLKTTPASSWPNPVWLFREARSVQAGDQLTIHYNYNTRGNNSEVRLAK